MKKFIKSVCVFFSLFIILNVIIHFTYEYPVYKAIENKTHKNYLKWNDIHKNKNLYDLIIMGSSRAYTSVNPIMLDSLINTNSYNMGTSAQDIAESYYMLEEIYEYQNPKYIIMDLFFPSSDNSHDYYQIFSNASFLNSYKIKFKLITKPYGVSGIANYTVPMLKLKNYVKQDLINFITSKKKQKKIETNWKKGFLYDTTTVTKKQISNFTPISNFKNTTFNKERFNKYINKIIALAKVHNTKIICIRTPYPPTRFNLSEIDDEGKYFSEVMKKENIPFYDFNDDNKKHLFTDQDFSDYHHPNYKGAEKLSKELVKIITINK